jgi:hypothetical protein
MSPVTRLLALSTLLSAAHTAAAQTFDYAINQPASSATYNFSVSAPFQTTPAGSSYLVGNAAGPDGIPGNADDVPTGTRTIPGITGGNTALNTIVNLNSGNVSASGNNGSTVVRPSGAFRVAFNTAGGTSTLSGLNVNLLGGAAAGISASVTINYPAFRTRQPTCTIFIAGIPITVPVGEISVTSLIATQATPTSAGTLTPVAGQPGVFTFSIPVELTVEVSATLDGAAVPIDPQSASVTVVGTVDLNAPNAAVNATIAINQSETVPGPTPLAPIPFPEPLCGGNLLVLITLASTTVNIVSNSTLVAAGTPVAPANPADFNRDGIVNPDDLSDFITGYFTVPPDPACDFNGDTIINPDDLSDYITVYFNP